MSSPCGAARRGPESALDSCSIRRSRWLQRPPHFITRAKRVICLFMNGTPSQVDTFDYKPELQKLGRPACPRKHQSKTRDMTTSAACSITARTSCTAAPSLPAARRKAGCGSRRSFRISPGTRTSCASSARCISDSSNHAPATYLMNTGVVLAGRPSLGSWVTYGLGSENQNLPGFVVLFDVGPVRRRGESQRGVSAGRLPGNAVLQRKRGRVESPPPAERTAAAAIDATTSWAD